MNKKIAIISPHNEPNYGTMLQAYALANTIESLGGVAEYISYQNFIKKNFIGKVLYYAIRPHIIAQKFNENKKMNNIDDYSFFCSSEFVDTMREFEIFYNQYIPHSKITYNPKTIHNAIEYSKYIVGSDQTWSPNLYNKYSINFLDFVKDDLKKNAYAPSLGTTDISEEFKNILKLKLAKFVNLSCREKQNCELIERLTEKEVTHVLDPTLLLTADKWDMVAKEVNMPPHYVLCYILGEKKCISDFAEILGENKNIPVYYIAVRPIYLQKNNSLNGIGPSQLISLIKNATYVVTDSFHGTIFSINYKRNFYSFTKRSAGAIEADNVRIIEVLKDYNLTNRFKADHDNKLEDDISFNKVNGILEKKREDSINYLKKIIA